MKTNLKELHRRIGNVANRLIFLEKKSLLNHGSLKLHPSEIHLMLVISQEPDLNAGEMASRLNVTTGAVSQTLSRLEKKGALVKQRDPARKNKVRVSFTREGKEALDAFNHSRAGARMEFAAYLEGLSESEGKTVAEFLDRWDEMLAGLG